MAKVFISFVREDKSIAETVGRIIEYELKLHGQVFLMTDQSQVLAGDDWLTRIREELTSADIVLLMLSKRSIKQPWVNFEAGAAWIMKKRTIPVCFGSQQKDHLPNPYSHWQALELPSGQEYLLNTIARDLKILPPHVEDRLMSIIEPTKQAGPTNQEGLSMMLKMMRDLPFALKHWQDEP